MNEEDEEVIKTEAKLRKLGTRLHGAWQKLYPTTEAHRKVVREAVIQEFQDRSQKTPPPKDQGISQSIPENPKKKASSQDQEIQKSKTDNKGRSQSR